MSESSTTRPAAKGRVVFIDQARALAILMMLFGHSLDRFLGEPWRSGQLYGDYQFVRGITSALFLMVSGFSFVVASFGHWDDYIRWSPRLWGRVRRIALIFLLGYVLHLWAPTLTQSVHWFSPGNWERFLRFDVLQNIAFGLTLLHVLALVVRRRERFWKAALAALAVVLLLAPLTYHPQLDARLPAGLTAALNLYHLSRFPVVPFTGYLLLGAIFGHWFWLLRRSGAEGRVIAALAGCGAIFLLFEHVIRNLLDGGLFPYSTPAAHMPGNTFARAGCAMLAISGLYLLGRYKLVLRKLSFILSKDSLTIYFVHLGLVYGGLSMPSMFRSHAHLMTPSQAAAWIASLVATMTLMAWGIGWLRDNRPRWLSGTRHVLLVGGLTAFALWPRLTAARVALALAVGIALVLIRERRRVMAAGRPDPLRSAISALTGIRRRLQRPLSPSV